MSAQVAFALAAALHAGFQVTVSVLVYPTLARRGAEEWVATHDAHSRAIVPLVVVVYAGLVGTGAWLVASGPTLLGWAALLVTGLALLVTALVAAPLHGRLGVRDDDRVRRLIVGDRWRCAAAVLGALLAIAGAGP